MISSKIAEKENILKSIQIRKKIYYYAIHKKNPHISAIHLKNVQIWVEMKSFLQFVLIQIIKRGLIS